VRWIIQHDQDAQDPVQEASIKGQNSGALCPRSSKSAAAHREVAACQLHSGVSFETSKTPRSVVLAVSRSTIKRLSEYILLKILLLRSPHLYLSASKFILTAKEIRIKTRTQRRPVPIVVFEIRSLLVTRHGTYQPGVNSRPR
jgi:hypothetical protein